MKNFICIIITWVRCNLHTQFIQGGLIFISFFFEQPSFWPVLLFFFIISHTDTNIYFDLVKLLFKLIVEKIGVTNDMLWLEWYDRWPFAFDTNIRSTDTINIPIRLINVRIEFPKYFIWCIFWLNFSCTYLVSPYE